jgi:hypothetical protein
MLVEFYQDYPAEHKCNGFQLALNFMLGDMRMMIAEPLQCSITQLNGYCKALEVSTESLRTIVNLKTIFGAPP